METKQAFEVITQVVNAALAKGVFTNTAEAATVHVALQTLSQLVPQEDADEVEAKPAKRGPKKAE